MSACQLSRESRGEGSEGESGHSGLVQPHQRNPTESIVSFRPPQSHLRLFFPYALDAGESEVTAKECEELGSKYQFRADHVRPSSPTVAAHHGWTQSCW